ncbi:MULTISPECIES: hypothetical protein [unclassified Streptomyces]|uniref:hypothetical protein n=1 Tax=unclassified Streptomyces TaxID=2593676 RepID=UPI00225B6758|nr:MULTISPECIES: hypothetical protein [unclassified Streptomyces]MCX5142296.1 hypothetical protein [Streptomyces sp. NBC_00338]WRZ69989.1 hypothetical protein OG408_24045 [Streptomyces sp. NBC_01257]WSU63855.1 hypothetical protein OG450_24305 [Streptomyces sp. NBC_01104]
MAALTAAAVAAVGFLAYQASANVPDNLGATPKASASAPAKGGHAKPKAKKDPLAVPAASGTGMRVVYALGDRRVWLVDAKGKPSRTFKVMPSAVSALPGTYRVSSRSGSVTGSDGVPIEHVVRFATNNDVAIGFSAAQDGSMESPDPTLKAGGVRMSREDGNAVWTFATVGVKVNVVP